MKGVNLGSSASKTHKLCVIGSPGEMMMMMDRPGVRQVPEGSGEQGKMEKTGCKIICGAPTTLAIKGLMMMLLLMMMIDQENRQQNNHHK